MRYTGHIFRWLSMLAGAACVVFWARSIGTWDSIGYGSRAGTLYELNTSPNRIEIGLLPEAREVYREFPSYHDGWMAQTRRWGAETAPGFIATRPKGPGLGIYWVHGFKVKDAAGQPYIPHRYVGVGIPFWLLIVLLALWPVRCAWVARRQRRRAARGLCLNCGYDLRATPNRCPECGVTRRD